MTFISRCLTCSQFSNKLISFKFNSPANLSETLEMAIHIILFHLNMYDVFRWFFYICIA